MANKQPLPGFKDAAPADRYCDLVLTGGVTSAIAYPGVIFGLAQAYRFHSIGGSSSGAGSAALAAAAEFRRRHGSSEGFRLMLERTRQVAEEERGSTRLRWLFQAEPGTRRLFDALLPAFVGPERRGGALVRGVARAYAAILLEVLAVALLVPLILGVCLGSSAGHGWLFALFLVLLALGGWTLWQAIRSDILRLVEADFGLCSGLRPPDGGPDDPEPITPWLHHLIQDIAGLPRDRPLTFEDLARAPGGPAEILRDASKPLEDSIGLEMYASNVTERRPQRLPQAEDEQDLYFVPRELRRLFPDEVVDAMKLQPRQPRASAIRQPKPGHRDGDPYNKKPCDELFWLLPRKRLPVLVAARMSVSFPLLFSAVPLWREDGSGLMRRLLIADGGLCSNFPIHLFDSPVPAWPTFGVALRDDDGAPTRAPGAAPISVRVPTSVHDRTGFHGPAPGARQTPLQAAWSFGMDLFGTMKDWNDTLQAELPGVRERLAHVFVPPGVGGLNILMTARQIEALGEAGGEVARQFLQRYAIPAPGAAQGAGWREHRWMRFNVLAQCLRDISAGLARSAQGARYAEPLRDQIRDARSKAPLPGTPVLAPAQAAELEQVLDALLALEAHLTPARTGPPVELSPRPALRVRSSR